MTNFWNKCDISCKTCQKDSYLCIECADGYFNYNGIWGKCFKDYNLTNSVYLRNSYRWDDCNLTCDKCNDPSEKCLKCASKYNYYAKENEIAPYKCYYRDSIIGYYFDSSMHRF